MPEETVTIPMPPETPAGRTMSQTGPARSPTVARPVRTSTTRNNPQPAAPRATPATAAPPATGGAKRPYVPRVDVQTGEVVTAADHETAPLADTSSAADDFVSFDTGAPEGANLTPRKIDESPSTKTATKTAAETVVADPAAAAAAAAKKEAGFAIPGAEEKPAAAAAAATAAGGRDYSLFDEADVPLLKKLDNTTFNTIAPALKRAKEERAELAALKVKAEALELRAESIPNYAAEDPNAYVLDPRFGQMLEADANLSGFNERLEAALLNAAEGNASEYPEFDATGNYRWVPVPNEDGRINNRLQVKLQTLNNEFRSRAQQVRAQMEHFKVGYSHNFNLAKKQLADMDAKFFKGMDPSKLTGEDKENYDLMLAGIPETYRRHPLAAGAGKAYVAFNQLLRVYLARDARVKELEAQLAQGSGAANGAAIVAPIPGAATPGDQFVPFDRP